MPKFRNNDFRMLAFKIPDSYKPSQQLLKLSMQMLLIIKLSPIAVLYKFPDRSITESRAGKYSNRRLPQPNNISPCSSSAIDSIKKVTPVMDLSERKCR